MGKEMTKPNQQSLKELLQSSAIKARFNEIMGKKAAGFMVSILNAVNQNAQLQKADPQTVLFAAGIAASLDLPIDPNLGFAYLIPYNNKQPDGSYKTVCQFQIGYKGIIQLALRSGQYLNIGVCPVYEGDTDQTVMQRLTAIIKPDKPSDTLKGFAAYFKLLNGFEKSLYMSISELNEHGSKYSKTFTKQSSKWKTDFEAMAGKTVLKLLISKYGPMTVDLQKAVTTDQAVVKNWEGDEVQYVDNEEVKVDQEAHSKAIEAKRVIEFINDATTLEDMDAISDKVDFDNEKLAEAFNSKYNEMLNELDAGNESK